MEKNRNSQEEVACIYFVFGGSTLAVLRQSLAWKGEGKVLVVGDTDCHGLGNCLLTEHGPGRHYVEPELQRMKNFCWGFCLHPNSFLCLFWYLSVVHWATSKKTGLQHLPLESLVPLLKWINQFLMPDIKTLTKCMWLSTPLISVIVLN